jgi:hypothetical protein
VVEKWEEKRGGKGMYGNVVRGTRKTCARGLGTLRTLLQHRKLRLCKCYSNTNRENSANITPTYSNSANITPTFVKPKEAVGHSGGRVMCETL